MAIPSGSGTEVLKRHIIDGLGNSQTEVIGGVANHIYTIISITICETGGAAEKVNLKITDADDSDPHYIMNVQDIAAYSTFVWNDKFVISGDKKLVTNTEAAAALDVYVSYIDQDWSK